MLSKGVLWFLGKAFAIMIAVIIIALFPRESSKIPVWIWLIVVTILVVVTIILWYRLILNK